METEFDTSWIEEQERLQTMQMNYSREHMKNINIYFIYINRENSVEKIIREKHPLVYNSFRNCSLLYKENVLGIIQTRKIYTPTSKYKFEDVMLYNIDIEPDNIQTFANTEANVENSTQFLKVLPFIGDVEIPLSIFIFHELNSLFFLFKEYELHKPLSNHSTTIRSILKIAPLLENGVENIPIKHTKKVRIQTNIGQEFIKNKYRKTRKMKMRMKHMPVLENTAI